MEKPRIVLDTNVLVSALRSRRGASFRVLSLFRAGAYRLAISVPLILEYEDVLLRNPADLHVSSSMIRDILDQICAAGDKFDIHFLWRPVLRDPQDDHVLELAVSSRSRFIVTYNLKDFVEARRFGIKILTPRDLLRELGDIDEHG